VLLVVAQAFPSPAERFWLHPPEPVQVASRPASADVVTTQTTFPTTFEARLTKEAVLKTRVEMLWRVVGGTMSLRAVMRSKRDSSTDASESREEREAELDVRDDEGDE
jgi:hypothetical protein